jgi:hypothetical protein
MNKEEMMDKEMKSKEDGRRMTGARTFRAAVLSLIVLSSSAIALARPASPPPPPPPGGCDDVKLCLQQIEQKISKLRAYVAHLKPGDPVEFTQQPREATPLLRQGFETYTSLQEQLAFLK